MSPLPPPRVLIVMGVSGVGKTTVGEALAAALGWPFLDADAFHPPANVRKMANGTPLTDADRAPWLAALRAEIARHLDVDAPLVLACSALRRAYRVRLRVDGRVRFVYLHAPEDVLAARLTGRTHFMPPALLASQLATLEPPECAYRVDAARPLAAIVADVVEGLFS